LLAGSLALAAPLAAEDSHPIWCTVYLQQAFPKQTRTNAQIQEINQMFGTHFDTWDDIANLSIGTQLYFQLSPRWKVGAELDYSRGGISGSGSVPTEAGPASITFEQKYSVYADLLAIAQFLPCSSCSRLSPFLYGGAGIGYERDKTRLRLANDLIDSRLEVDNDGTFPVLTAGVGADWFFTAGRRWYLEAGVAYYWGRLDHQVAASGDLAPAPTVRADNDTTGPNYWLGLGIRF
jgi:hypothetical protein